MKFDSHGQLNVKMEMIKIMEKSRLGDAQNGTVKLTGAVVVVVVVVVI